MDVREKELEHSSAQEKLDRELKELDKKLEQKEVWYKLLHPDLSFKYTKTQIHKKDRTKRLEKLVDKSFSSLKKDLEFVETSSEECNRKRREEDKRLECVSRDFEVCSRELENKKKLACFVRRINVIHNKMIGKIEGCVLRML